MGSVNLEPESGASSEPSEGMAGEMPPVPIANPPSPISVRTTRSVTVKKINEIALEELQNQEDSTAFEAGTLQEDPEPEQSCSTVVEEEGRRKNQTWSTNETSRFYQGLKEYGKSFDLVSKFMSKYKLNRDKVAIQKYYFNLFKTYRAMTKVTDAQMSLLPRDARELFIVINGCEWKTKTNGLKICQESFRTLLMTGVTTVKLRNRKVVIKTPNCKALRQFFKYDEKFANIPKQLALRISPQGQADKDYVLSCEQNPFLYIKIDMNDALVSLFDLLKMKWLPKHVNMKKVSEETSFLPEIKLMMTDTLVLPKLIVRRADDCQRRMCMQSLIKYCEDRNEIVNQEPPTPSEEVAQPVLGMASPNRGAGGIARKKSKIDTIPSSIVVDSCSVTDFNFRTDILTKGMTRESVTGLSALHLYLITGMQCELKFTYQVLNVPVKSPSIWELFVSFVKRDYLWYGTDYMVNGTTHAFRKQKKQQQQKKIAEKEIKEVVAPPPEEVEPVVPETEIVQDEMLGFLEQWNSMSKTSARLHNHDPEPVIDTAAPGTSPPTIPQDPNQAGPSRAIPANVPRRTSVVARPRSLLSRKRRYDEDEGVAPKQLKEEGPQTPKEQLIAASAVGQPTDFSFLIPSSSKAPPPPPAAPNAFASMIGLDGHTNITMDRTNDGMTLHKAFTEDLSNQIGLMNQQESVDYCRQFEDFVNYFQSPQKMPKL
uniref:Myb-like domain-containing protein n=1 Tax=Panagrellus redivivus TaxID=6233 RepID=A0A7E4V1Z8_PANRE